MSGDEREEQSISIRDLEYLPVSKTVKESIRVQRTEYIRQQMRKRRDDEDALMVQLMQEQRVIDGMRKQINENLEQTEAGSRYNRELKESMNTQIYALHGISQDKLEGMREYKNAYYQGCTFALFLLSVGLFIISGLLHGFQSEICVFMLSYTGIEGALLAQEHKRWKPARFLCRLLYICMFPLMLVMFVFYELRPAQYQFFLPYVMVTGICIVGFAAVSYFLYNPYRGLGKKAREARRQIVDIEKIARKEVRKTKKKHSKETKKLELSAKKEDRQQARRNRRKKFFSFFKRRESQADLEVGIEKSADDGQPDANAIKK
ncbi:MAG: hypothetical protein HFH35_10700 [Eubacterium sp.]|nr:hypothetical protein [Eubacterium sp.]